MKFPIRVVWNKDRYYEVWIGKNCSEFEPIGLGMLVGILLMFTPVIIIGLVKSLS